MKNYASALEAEQVGQRASIAINQFACKEDREALDKMRYILPEVRHAASCAYDAKDDGRLEEAKKAIMYRLWANLIDPGKP